MSTDPLSFPTRAVGDRAVNFRSQAAAPVVRCVAFALLILAGPASGQSSAFLQDSILSHVWRYLDCAEPGHGSEVETGAPLFMTLHGYAANASFRLADDFTVPAGDTWTINSFKVPGYQPNSGIWSSLNSADYRIWSGTPGAGGFVIHDFSSGNQLLNTSWSGVYRATTANLGQCTGAGLARPVMEVEMNGNGIVLGPGTYWLDFALGGNLASGPFVPPVTILGTGETGNALQQITATGVWNGIASGSTFPGPYPQGLPIDVNYWPAVPRFDVFAVWSGPSIRCDLRVLAPPSSDLDIYFALAQGPVLPLLSGVVGADGTWSLQVPVQGDIQIPEVLLGAVIRTPGSLPVFGGAVAAALAAGPAQSPNPHSFTATCIPDEWTYKAKVLVPPMGVLVIKQGGVEVKSYTNFSPSHSMRETIKITLPCVPGPTIHMDACLNGVNIGHTIMN